MERMRGILGREELRRCVKGLDFDFNAAAEGEEGVEDVAEDEDDLEEDDEVMRARDQARERAARAERDRIFVLASIASGFRDAEVRIELLQAQNLPFSFFSSSPVQDIVEGGGAGEAFTRACESVKDLTLWFSDRNVVHWPDWHVHGTVRALRNTESNLRTFLASLGQLEILAVAFDNGTFSRSGHGLCAVLPTMHIWSKLSSIHLDWLYVEGPELVTLLANHAETLRCIHWSGMVMRTDMAGDKKKRQWREVFQQIGSMDLRHGGVFEGWSFGSEEEQAKFGDWKGKGRGGREVVIRTDLMKYLEGGEEKEEDGVEEDE